MKNFNFEIDIRIPGTIAKIRQVRPKFKFGSNIFPLGLYEGEQLQTYKDRIRAVWNAGTLPFYWGTYEMQEGNPDPAGKVMESARWAQANGFTLKGHPLCWHTLCADWLMNYDDDTILGKQLDRIRRDVTLYKGVVNTWDVINETVIMPIFDKYDNAVSRIARRFGTVELVLKCFAAAREANPDATLLINDFDLSPSYAQIIRELLDRGCSIDAIGLQTHMHEGYRGKQAIETYLNRFSVFNLPLHFTELTILSGQIAPKVEDLNDLHIDPWPSTSEGEQRQLEETEEFYRQVYVHPLVESIVWWDMVDGNWLKAPAGLLRSDLSTKPAFERIKKIITEEWAFKESEYSLAAGSKIRINAPEGLYEAIIDGKSCACTLDASTPSVSVI